MSFHALVMLVTGEAENSASQAERTRNATLDLRACTATLMAGRV